jgi:hypothetical protein
MCAWALVRGAEIRRGDGARRIRLHSLFAEGRGVNNVSGRGGSTSMSQRGGHPHPRYPICILMKTQELREMYARAIRI